MTYGERQELLDLITRVNQLEVDNHRLWDLVKSNGYEYKQDPIGWVHTPPKVNR